MGEKESVGKGRRIKSNSKSQKSKLERWGNRVSGSKGNQSAVGNV